MNKPKINNPLQLSVLVEVQATYHKNMVVIYKLKTPSIKVGEGFEIPRRSSGVRLDDDIDVDFIESNLERSIRRSKKAIRDYALNNDFDMFATFTFKVDRADVEKCRQKMSDWLRNQRNRQGKFRYVMVAEFNSDDKALHFHALLGGYGGKISRSINPRTNKPLKQKGRDVYTLEGYALGFTNVKLIGNEPEDMSRISAYIQKYITKDIAVFPNKQRYRASKGLLHPTVEDNPDKWYEHVTPDWEKEFKNGTIMRFNVNKKQLENLFLDIDNHYDV
jgi:hypothetical protein